MDITHQDFKAVIINVLKELKDVLLKELKAGYIQKQPHI